MARKHGNKNGKNVLEKCRDASRLEPQSLCNSLELLATSNLTIC